MPCVPVKSVSARRLTVALLLPAAILLTSAGLLVTTWQAAASQGARPQKRTGDKSPRGGVPETHPAAVTTPGQAGAPSAEAVAFFEKSVRPVLAENCYQCHAKGTGLALGGLQMDSQAALVKGGNHGAVIAAGQPDKSLLIRAISYNDKNLLMPPKGRLTEEQIKALTQWVKMGAPWPARDTSRPAPSSVFDIKERAKHWAWQPVIHPPLPKVKNTAWAQSPIDRFILAKLEANHLTPAPPADKRTLIRRVTYDLTGLPPTSTEIDAFLGDKSPNAYEKVVDRLLASPHYGERWARHWLDLVRFAETDGHEFDFEKHNAFQYRDYVIRAFNADIPYNLFVTEHLAGDLLPQPRLNPVTHTNESLIGTGFFWLGEGKHSPVELQADEAERIDNQIDVMSKTFLGLSLGCARCHNHKFDAISTKDYYALAGFLKSSRFQLASIANPAQTAPTVQGLQTVALQLQPLAIQNTVNSQLPVLDQIKSRLLSAHLTAGTTRLAAEEPGADIKRATAEAWANYLQKTAAKDLSNPLYSWAILSGEAGRQEGAAFSQRRVSLAKQLQAQAESLQKETQEQIVFADFSRDTYKDWFVTGEAFGEAPVKAAYQQAETGSRLRIEGIMGPGIADSGAISDRLQGVLRSKTFILSKNHIFYRMAGQGGQVKLIIDGFQRIQAPIYGGLIFSVNTGLQPTWFGMDVSKWIGQRAYIEVHDSGPGRVAVERIVFTDQGAPADPPNPLILKMVNDPAVSSSEALAQRYQELFRETAQLWSAGTLETAQDARGRFQIVQWMLQNRALLNSGLPGKETPSDLQTAMASLLEKRRRLEAALPDMPRIPAMTDGTPEDDLVHVRGNFKTLGDVVPRRFLEAVAGAKQPAPHTGSGRLELARRMTEISDPLLPRVLVNRLWQHHFGEGIVRTPDDFGMMGERPTHPELLDWLAQEFIKQEWSLKKMHRLMVLSSAYQMSSRPEAKAEEADSQNRLLHRMPIRRLEAECIRDGILAVSGSLDEKMYGPSIMPYLTDFMLGRGRPDHSGPVDGAGRRSIYLSVRRNFLNPMFLAFDYPVPFTTIGRRSVSNVPAQALAMMNNPFVVQQAELWAKRALAEPNKTPQERITGLYLKAFGRSPTDAETTDALAFLTGQTKTYGTGSDLRAWSDLCHVLFNVKEFIFVN